MKKLLFIFMTFIAVPFVQAQVTGTIAPSGLPPMTTLTGSETFLGDQGVVTKTATLSQLAAYFLKGLTIGTSTGTFTVTSSGTLTLTGTGVLNINGGGTLGSAAFMAGSAFEPALGNPSASGYVLTSTGTGGRSWVIPSAISGALLAANNLGDLTDTAAARSHLGVIIGTNVEAWSSVLDTLAGANPFIAGNAVTLSGTWPNLTISVPNATTLGNATTGTGSIVLSNNPALTGTATLNGNAPNTAGGFATADGLKVAPAGTSVICLGDSLTAGAGGPYVVPSYPGSSGWSYTGPGYSYPQWLSTLPFFKNVPVYVFASGGATSANVVTVLTNTTNYGSEFMNGTLVGTLGGLSGAVSSYVSSTGPTYCLLWIGTNDAQGSVSNATFQTNIQSIYATLHGYGPNVRISAGNVIQLSFLSGAMYTRLYNTAAIPSSQATLTNTAGWDSLVDLGSIFTNPLVGAEQGIYYTDKLHLTSLGYQIVADKFLESINHKFVSGSQLQSPSSMAVGQPPFGTGAVGSLAAGQLVFDPAIGNNSSGQNSKILLYYDLTGLTAGIGVSFNSTWNSYQLEYGSTATFAHVFTTGTSIDARVLTSGVQLPSGSVFSVASSTADTTADTSLSRESAGVWDFGTGANGSTAGSWKATSGTLNTLLVKGGTNSLSGTVTLVSGTATITSSAFDSNTLGFASVRTASGTQAPYLVSVSGTTMTITGTATDASTLNWVAVKVNQ